LLRQQFGQVVAGHAPRNLRIAAADQVGVAIANAAQAGADLAAPAAGGDDACKFLFAGGADPHAQPVIGDDVHGVDVVGGAPAHDRVHAAGVVADHAAQGVVAVGGRVRRKGEVMLFRHLAQVVQYAAGFHAGAAALHVDAANVVQVFGEVDDHCHVATLAGKAGAGAARQDGQVVAIAERDGLFHVRHAARNHHADGHLPVKGGIGGVERAAAVIE